MLVSLHWLAQYVSLTGIAHADLTERLMMAGLNHESTEPADGGDFCVDLEVTSNRPDCLGHIGVAREVAVLYGRELKLPAPQPPAGAANVADLVKVKIDAPELCQRYTARVIRGVKIGPSPKWLVDRLKTIGQPSINNVVDITNYVLMECGQPLHAFDLAKLSGQQIIVRRAKKNEPFVAIDHKTYALDERMCVIADASQPVAIGGVMGGEGSEVTTSTRDLVIESAQFAPLAIRTTSRALRLSSDSSYRFERGTDPAGVDWASRRCCELILELAGGELASGVIDLGPAVTAPLAVSLRMEKLNSVLGISVPESEVRRILTALGCVEQSSNQLLLSTTPPSWRRDLTREIDLVEEVARIHGYDQIPENVGVPMAASHRSDADRVLAKVRGTLTATGFDEAFTRSVVSEAWSKAYSPWSAAEPLQATTPMLKGEDRVRKSVIPSLLGARKYNESVGNSSSELFETARVYLAQGDALPQELSVLAAVSEGKQGYLKLKGVVETLVSQLRPAAPLTVHDSPQALLDPEASCELKLAGQKLGYLGKVSAAGLKQFGLKRDAAVLEIDLAVLSAGAILVPKYAPISSFPAMSRDLNLIVDEAIRWADLATTASQCGGNLLEKVEYKDTYRDPQKDGVGKKRLLLSLTIRSTERTLTSEEADSIASQVITACGTQHGAVLLG